VQIGVALIEHCRWRYLQLSELLAVDRLPENNPLLQKTALCRTKIASVEMYKKRENRPPPSRGSILPLLAFHTIARDVAKQRSN
jgi:hypothetical protein